MVPAQTVDPDAIGTTGDVYSLNTGVDAIKPAGNVPSHPLCPGGNGLGQNAEKKAFIRQERTFRKSVPFAPQSAVVKTFQKAAMAFLKKL